MADWIETKGEPPPVDWDTVIEALGRYGDVFGPLPMGLFAPDAWAGNMLHGSHDLSAWRPANA